MVSLDEIITKEFGEIGTKKRDAFEKGFEEFNIDKKLDRFRGKALFPKKLELANKLLENAKLPETIN